MQLKALRGAEAAAGGSGAGGGDGAPPMDENALRLHTYIEAAMEAIEMRYLKSMVRAASGAA